MDRLRTSQDISDRVEAAPVSASKDVQIKEIMDFVYVRCNIPGPGMSRTKFSSEFEGCVCSSCSCDSTCACISRFGNAYDDQGRLIIVDPYSDKMRPIYECNTSCKCNQSCTNRVVQRGVTCQLQVFDTKTKGLGLRSIGPISKNQFVCEYAGEVVPLEVAKTRTKNLKRDQPNYILVLKEHTAEGEMRTHIDPTYIGNAGRFINHSCEPNLYMVPIRANNDIPHVALFAIRDIVSGEELTYDYSGTVQAPDGKKSPDNTNKVDSNKVVIGPNQSRCRCGSARCRGVLPFEESLYEK